MKYNTRFWISIFVIVTTAICNIYADDPNPGYTSETRELHEGNNTTIECRMSLNHFPGKNATDLKFVNVLDNEAIPDKYITVLNETTIIYHLNNAPLQKSTYRCYCDNKVIGETKVYVGTKPQKVDFFNCTNYDFDYIVCKFKKQLNNVSVRNYLSYYTDNPYYLNSVNCNFDKPIVVCDATDIGRKHWSKPEKFHFKLDSSNELGTRTDYYHFNILDITIPAKPGNDFRIKQMDTNSAIFEWKIPKWDYYRSKGFKWEIRLQPEDFPEYILKSDYLIKHETHQGLTTFILHLLKLEYAFYLYKMTLRYKIRNDSTIKSALLWSEPFVFEFKTNATIPSHPPRTDIGGFYIDPSEIYPRIRLYWEELQPWENNGANFTYAIRNTKIIGNANGRLLEPIEVQSNSAVFEWEYNHGYTYEIYSKNHMGKSKQANYIEIFPMTVELERTHKPREIHNVYDATNRTFTLSWLQPENTTDLMNFTVFWCASKQASLNGCKGSIHFAQVDKSVFHFTTAPQSAEQEHTLNLAVSANYLHYSSGMHWTTCTQDKDSDLIKMTPTVEPLSATELRVQWSPESICPSILSYFNLSYCELDETLRFEYTNGTNNNNNTANHNSIINKYLDNLPCKEQKMISIPLHNTVKEYKIQNLQPYTEYKLEMYMASTVKRGRTSDPKRCRTLEAAPSVPRYLQVTNVSDNTATISWLPPSKLNGIIRKYIITLNGKDINLPIVMINATATPPLISNQQQQQQRIIYNLENLNSFTTYNLSIAAVTNQVSNSSESITFQTLIGVPSAPNEIHANGGLNGNSNKNDNETISWTIPEKRAGNLDYYEVAFVKIIDQKIISGKVSIIAAATHCTISVPKCAGADESYEIRVRAVNVANITNNYYLASNQTISYREKYHTKYYDNNEETLLYDYIKGDIDLQCIGGRFIDDAEFKLYYNNTKEHYLLKSNWRTGPKYGCYTSGGSRLVFFIFTIFFIIPMCLSLIWILYKKYQKMANITCTLPPSLEDYKNTKSSLPSHGAEFENVSPGIMVAAAVMEKNEKKISLPPGQKEKLPELRIKDFMFHNEKHHLLPGDVVGKRFNRSPLNNEKIIKSGNSSVELQNYNTSDNQEILNGENYNRSESISSEDSLIARAEGMGMHAANDETDLHENGSGILTSSDLPMLNDGYLMNSASFLKNPLPQKIPDTDEAFFNNKKQENELMRLVGQEQQQQKQEQKSSPLSYNNGYITREGLLKIGGGFDGGTNNNLQLNDLQRMINATPPAPQMLNNSQNELKSVSETDSSYVLPSAFSNNLNNYTTLEQFNKITNASAVAASKNNPFSINNSTNINGIGLPNENIATTTATHATPDRSISGYVSPRDLSCFGQHKQQHQQQHFQNQQQHQPQTEY